jgi:hypothetical protein
LEKGSKGLLILLQKMKINELLAQKLQSSSQGGRETEKGNKELFRSFVGKNYIKESRLASKVS